MPLPVSLWTGMKQAGPSSSKSLWHHVLATDDMLFSQYNFGTNEYMRKSKVLSDRSLVQKCFILYLAVKSMHINKIKVISITSEMIWYQSLVFDISLYFHCSVFLDHLWLFHSLNAAHFESSNACNFLICQDKHQVWVVIFLVRTWGTFWYQINSDLLKFFDFEFSTPPASVSEAMHVTYTMQRHQQSMTSLMTSLVSHFDAE